MRLLLDTHALIWLVEDDPRLHDKARDAILDPANDVFVSIVSFWEIAVKIRVGKFAGPDVEKLMAAVTGHGLTLLPFEPRHIVELLRLPFYPDHRDPFDHQLIAQAIAEALVFVSEDENTSRYAVRRTTCSNGPTTV